MPYEPRSAQQLPELQAKASVPKARRMKAAPGFAYYFLA
jgi:hypothetical protein